MTKESLYDKCGWSPFEGERFDHSISMTIVSGQVAFEKGKVNEATLGHALTFDRQ